MMEIGRMCVKIAGRDSNGKCVVIDVIDEKYVIIDGQVRRKKCNITHLEPLNDVLKIKKNESHENIVKLFSEKGIELESKSTKERKPKAEKTEKPEAKKEKEEKPKKEKKM